VDWVASGKTEAAAAEADRYVHIYIIYIYIYIYIDCVYICIYGVEKEKGLACICINYSIYRV
jgi:hypothetical protein